MTDLILPNQERLADFKVAITIASCNPALQDMKLQALIDSITEKELSEKQVLALLQSETYGAFTAYFVSGRAASETELEHLDGVTAEELAAVLVEYCKDDPDDGLIRMDISENGVDISLDPDW